MACTSAWAVGSLRRVTSLQPAASTRPLLHHHRPERAAVPAARAAHRLVDRQAQVIARARSSLMRAVSRAPKMAVPTRTRVAPSADRHLEVVAHAHRQLAQLDAGPRRCASRSRSRRSAAKCGRAASGSSVERRDHHQAHAAQVRQRRERVQQRRQRRGRDAALLRLARDVDLHQAVLHVGAPRRPRRRSTSSSSAGAVHGVDQRHLARQVLHLVALERADEVPARRRPGRGAAPPPPPACRAAPARSSRRSRPGRRPAPPARPRPAWSC